MSLDLELINALNLGHADLHLIPVAAGAANGKGVAKTVLGVALIGGAIFLSGGTLAAPLSMLSNPVIAGIGVTWGNIATIGLGLTFAGASSLMTKPTTTLDAKADQSKSFNAIAPGDQGNAIPLIYGETVVQGVPISFDSDVEDTRAYANESFPGLFGSVADALVKAGAI